MSDPSATSDGVSPQPAQVLEYVSAPTNSVEQEIVRRRNALVTPTMALLPPVCVKTGATDDLVEKQTNFTYVPPWLILLIFLPFGLLILLIVYFVMRKTGSARYHVQRQFISRRRGWIAGGLGVMALSIAAFAFGIANELPAPIIIGIAGFFVGLIIAGFIGRILYAGKITQREMHLRGCGERFLSQFQAVQ
ncbi:MAG: hypothetical protein AAF656_11760 [Planctomycetota bacterium]